jgi:hypothetical protein
MALGEYLGVGPTMTRALGFAGLLHDLGKIRIPLEILNKAGRLTPEERQVVEAHPVEGARMLLAGRAPMEHAAVVAYEHHLMLDGGGYPRLHYPRAAQYPSRIVHVCDVFDALRTRRPYRDAWESARVLARSRTARALESLTGLAVRPTRWFRRRRLAPKSPELLAAIAGLAAHWPEEPRAQLVLTTAERHADADIRAAARRSA